MSSIYKAHERHRVHRRNVHFKTTSSINTIISHCSWDLMNFVVLFKEMCKRKIVTILSQEKTVKLNKMTAYSSSTTRSSAQQKQISQWDWCLTTTPFKSLCNKYDTRDRRKCQTMRWKQQLNHGAWNSTVYLSQRQIPLQTRLC